MSDHELIASRYSRLVALEPHDQSECELFFRAADGTVHSETVPFYPWLLIAGLELAKTIPDTRELIPLTGNYPLNIRVDFDHEKAYKAAVKYLEKITGFRPSSSLAPYRVFSDFTQQAMTVLPARLFQGMEFSELRRLQLDIETRTSVPGTFCDANRPDDSVLLVSLRDSSGWETCLSARDCGEANLLRKTLELIRQRDPDVIEGHNLCNFDLPYLDKRCHRHKIKFILGRNGQPTTSRPSRVTIGDRMIPFQRYEIYGRHVVDTFHLVQLYDLSHRDMEGYGLKAAARYFNINAPDRTYVNGADITRLFDTDHDLLMKYCLDDVRETDGVARLLSPSYFYQAQLIPLSYQNCIVRGNATRIDALLCAEYLHSHTGLPTPQAQQSFQGGLTESTLCGVFRNVWHIDVRSLYPSLILANHWHPASDRRGDFARLLGELRTRRLTAKDLMRTSPPDKRERWRALQESLKILINSFYGYAGFAQGTFNDYGLAAEVTAAGRDILSRMRDFLNQRGATVIEMDTDGIYFSPPNGVDDKESFAAEVQNILPEGIEIELDASYPAMFAYRSKNYALLEESGKIVLTGAALRSRGLEPFQRNYMREHIEMLLTGQDDRLDELYNRYAKALREHHLPLRDLAKREQLSTAPETYAEKLKSKSTRRSAAYELALRSPIALKQGDYVYFYVTGKGKKVSVTDNSKLLAEGDEQNRDENVEFYLSRLDQLRDKFSLGGDADDSAGESDA